MQQHQRLVLPLCVGQRSILRTACGRYVRIVDAHPLLVFCLLYTPCIAAVASVKRELGGKWAFIMVANQCIVAWLAAFGTRLIMML